MSISRKRLNQIKEIKDENINYSDSPELDEDFWANAKPVYPKGKKAISIRLDQEVIDFFKDQGKGYQSKINNVLRSYIETQH